MSRRSRPDPAEGRAPRDGRATAFVCRNDAGDLPVVVSTRAREPLFLGGCANLHMP